MSADELIDRAAGGDRAALARLITAIESGDPSTEASCRRLGPFEGAERIGITGPPGAGKSTLVNAMIGELRSRGQLGGSARSRPFEPDHRGSSAR